MILHQRLGSTNPTSSLINPYLNLFSSYQKVIIYADIEVQTVFKFNCQYFVTTYNCYLFKRKCKP